MTSNLTILMYAKLLEILILWLFQAIRDDMRIIYIQKTDLISLALLASNVGETCSFFCGWGEDALPQGNIPPSHGDQNWWSRCDSLVLRITDKATKVECKETVSMTPLHTGIGVESLLLVWLAAHRHLMWVSRSASVW